jgi:hypothetical protein
MDNNGNKLFETPILFLIFNRPDTTRQVFERIKQIKPRFFYVACDGPRSNKAGESEIVKATREWVINNITWDCEYKTLFREVNLGCGRAVSSSIDWFFQNVEMGIILEDDCLPDLSFFAYCHELLIRFKEDQRISSICAPNMLGDLFTSSYSYSFSNYCLVWGWATWRRAWLQYDFKLSNWPEIKKTDFLKKINNTLLFKIYWNYIFDLCYSGKINTWDYQWIYASWQQRGLSIIPSVNLIRNIGIGNNSTHHVDDYFSKFSEQQLLFPLIHPAKIQKTINLDFLLTEKIFTTTKLNYLKIVLMKFRIFKVIKKIYLARNINLL